MTYKHKSIMAKRRAFTLIELLIVIAIIGILFIVLVSKVDFATDKAKATGVQTDFRSFQMAFDTVAKENAGFNTFGWDTGDLNANGKRDSYDEGDANKDGIQDTGEIWTGHKVYAETFTKVFSLVKPGTTGYDREVLNNLETAINANLDPKLHITIKDDGEIIMANGAQDPWNKEYHGWYITNAETDKKDRGAIVMYSDGANNEFGSEHSIANGVVSISIPGNNKFGNDDMSIVSCYTYINGYGEVKNMTTGFSNNQSFLSGSNEAVNNDIDSDNTKHIIPVGATYTIVDGTVLYEGDEFPDIIQNGDKYVYGDYKYIYNYSFLGGYLNGTGTVIPMNNGTYNGWAVSVLETTKTTYDNFLTTINGIPVLSMAFAFKNCSIMTTIPEIPDTIINMMGAFEGCSSLTTESIQYLTIPTNCQNIIGLFIRCSKITDFSHLTLPNVKSLNSVFCGCSGVTSSYNFPDIPSTVTDLGATFSSCSGLHELDGIQISNNISCLDYTFAGTSISTLDGLVLPTNIKSLYYTFQGCSNLTDASSLVIPASLTSMSYTFWGCRRLTKAPTIPDTVTNIGYCFMDCSALMSIYIKGNPDCANAFKGSGVYTILDPDGGRNPNEEAILAASGKINPLAGIL